MGTCVASLWSSCSRGQHACLPAGRPAWDRGHGGPGRPPGWEGDQSLLGTFASGDTARYGWGPRTWSMRPVPASLTTPRPALSDSGPTHSLLPGSSPHSFAWLASHPLAPGLPGPPNQEACLPYSPSRFPLFPLHGTCHNLFCHTCWFTCFLAVSPLDCVPMSGTGEGLRNYLLKEWSYVTLSAILGVVTILAACCRSGNRCLEAESSAHGHPCGMWQSWPLGPCLPGGPQIMLEATPPSLPPRILCRRRPDPTHRPLSFYKTWGHRTNREPTLPLCSDPSEQRAQTDSQSVKHTADSSPSADLPNWKRGSGQLTGGTRLPPSALPGVSHRQEGTSWVFPWRLPRPPAVPFLLWQSSLTSWPCLAAWGPVKKSPYFVLNRDSDGPPAALAWGPVSPAGRGLSISRGPCINTEPLSRGSSAPSLGPVGLVAAGTPQVAIREPKTPA